MSRSREGEELNALIDRLNAKLTIDGWSQLCREVSAPQEFFAAFVTGRPELLKMVKPRALNEQECADIYKLVAVLIETNVLLQQHARHVADLVDRWENQFAGLRSVGKRIGDFANFRRPYSAEEVVQS